MTLTELRSKINTKFMKNFFLSIKSNKKILIFISVMQLLGLPVIATLLAIESSDSMYSSEVSFAAFLMISIFCLAAAVLCGIFVALSNFSYLYKKSQVDMVYSLPIKRRTKFLSDYFSGLAIYIVPFIAACVIADLILLAKIICDPEIIAASSSAAMKEIFPIVLQGEFAAVLMMTMLYTLTVVVTCCCGALFECILNMLMINAMIPGAIAVVSGLFFANLYGVPILETALPALGYTSPVGASIYLIVMLDDVGESCLSAVVYGKWVLIFILFIAAYFMISMFLYKKRKAEDVSKPYVYKLFYYMIITVIMMAISLIARFEIEVLFPVILFSLIVYMIFEVITNRGFKKFYLSFIKYGVTMIGILVMCVVSSATHGFGAEGRVYPASLVSSVEVRYTGIDDFQVSDMDEGYGGYYYDIFYGDSIKYKDKDIIKKMTELQEDIIDFHKKNIYDTYSDIDGSRYRNIYDYDVDQDLAEYYDYPMYYVQFKYNLKTGGSMVRNYQLNVDQIKQLFVLDHTEEMAEYRTKRLRELIDMSEYYRQHKTNYFELTYSLLKNISDNNVSIPLSYEEGKEFLEIYKQDYMNATTEELMTSKPVCYINAHLPIRESFKNTVEFIKSHGGLNEEKIPAYMSEAEGILYAPQGYESWGRNDITASFGYVETLGYRRNLNSYQTNKLLQYARSNYYEESDCYVLSINHAYYVIPSEYSDIAEEIYNQSLKQQYTFEDLLKDINASDSADSFIYDHLKGNYNFYNDITKIYDMRTMNIVPKEYILLQRFFGYTKLEEYEEYLQNAGVVYDGETLYEEFNRYKEEFPEISDEQLKFFEYIN